MEFVAEDQISTPAPNFEASVHLHCPEIQESNKGAIEDLRLQLISNNIYDENWCSDHLLFLFLIARNQNVAAAFEMMKIAWEWRVFRRPHEIQESPGWEARMSKESETGKIYVPGIVNLSIYNS